MSMSQYPSASGWPTTASSMLGVLAGMGACYESFNPQNNSLGIGMNGTTGDGCASLGTRALFEGQINTTGLAAGTYVLVLVPHAGSVLLAGTTCETDISSCFAAPANHILGDTISFELTEPSP